MKRKSILIIIAVFISVLFITGCSKDVLMPDRMGINFSQARYREEDAAYRGFGINFQWDLK